MAEVKDDKELSGDVRRCTHLGCQDIESRELVDSRGLLEALKVLLESRPVRCRQSEGGQR